MYKFGFESDNATSKRVEKFMDTRRLLGIYPFDGRKTRQRFKRNEKPHFRRAIILFHYGRRALSEKIGQRKIALYKRHSKRTSRKRYCRNVLAQFLRYAQIDEENSRISARA